jgi:hypothetical protein
MNRRGIISLTLLVLFSLAGLLAVRDAAIHGQRLRELAARQQRLQAREFALAADALAPGAALHVGPWTITRDATGMRSAASPAGTWTIDAKGGEHWRRP